MSKTEITPVLTLACCNQCKQVVLEYKHEYSYQPRLTRPGPGCNQMSISKILELARALPQIAPLALELAEREAIRVKDWYRWDSWDKHNAALQ